LLGFVTGGRRRGNQNDTGPRAEERHTLQQAVNLAVEMFQKKLAKIFLYRNADTLEMIVTGRVTRRPRVGERGTATETKLASGIALDLNFGLVSPGLATTSDLCRP
jgi:hypothetical protein